MSTSKLSVQDKRDLEKFTRFLALKAAQIIVQSRSGEKVHTKCKPNSSGTDWFNLAVQDLPEVLAEAKRASCEEIISSSIPLCIEISLRTVEGDSMVLETWNLGVFPELSDPSIRITYTVYNRMGILLKSLLTISRITPSYKLSQRQGPESYIICYRIYMGEPQLHSLGDNYKNIRVGQLYTPVGLIHLSVSYRTKMTISPTQSDKDSIMLKSDHFHSDLSPRHSNQLKERPTKSLSDNIKVGAFVASKQNKNEKLHYLDIPFSSLLIPHQIFAQTQFQTAEQQIIQPVQSVATITLTEFENVININNGNEKFDSDNIISKINSHCASTRSSSSIASINDDFIMVDLKTPFAAPNTHSDLGTFYRECQSAPQLHAFMEEQTLAEQVGDLTKQLEAFESNMLRYQDFCSMLCKSDIHNQVDKN